MSQRAGDSSPYPGLVFFHSRGGSEGGIQLGGLMKLDKDWYISQGLPIVPHTSKSHQ